MCGSDIEVGGADIGMTIRSNSPCMWCTERRVGCHADCSLYVRWSLENAEYKALVVRVGLAPILDFPDSEKKKPIRGGWASKAERKRR